MKITTKKIIRELENKGWTFNPYYFEDKRAMALVKDVRNIIDEILKQHKNITIR